MRSGSARRSGTPRGVVVLLMMALTLCTSSLPGWAQAPRAISFRTPLTLESPVGALLKPADWDGDGRLDLAQVLQTGVSFRFGRGDGTFSEPVHLPLGGGLHEGIGVDLNRDGALDLAICNNASAKLLLLFNQGNRTFAPAVHYPVQNEPVGVVAADFNEDGAPDLVVSNHRSHSFSVLLNRGDGTLHPAVHTGGADHPGGIVAADFNGDGHADLSQANLNSNVVRVYLGDGAGRLEFSGKYPTNDDYANVLVLDDYNADGRLDLAVGCLDGIALLFGDGSGAFSAPVGYGTHLLNSLDGGDLDGDGDTDLVASRSSFGFSIHQNHVSGNFLPGVTPGPDATRAAGLRIADLNGDSLPDIAAWSDGAPALSIFLNDSPRPTPAVRSFTVTPTSLVGGCGSAFGEVALTAPAPPGGAVVTLTSSNPAVSLPPAVTIPAGASSTTVPIAALPSGSTQASCLTAAYNGTARRTILTIRPGGIASLRLQPDRGIGGQPVTATVTLGCPVGTGALLLAVSSHPGAAAVPATLPVAPGATSVTFPVATVPVAQPTTVFLTVSGPGLTATATLTLLPASQPVAGNLLVNGSFELPLVGIGWYRLRVGDSLPGWRITSGDIDVIHGYWNAAPGQGEQSIDLMGSFSGTIDQTFPTVPGQEYLLTGWYAHNVDNPSREGIGVVTLNGQPALQLVHRDLQASLADMRWTPFAHRFRATGYTTTLAVTDMTRLRHAGGLALDGFSVVPVSDTGVPAILPFQVTPSAVIGGGAATGLISLAFPAGAGGAAFAVASSNPAAAVVPAVVIVAPGTRSVAFPVTTFPVASPTSVSIAVAGPGLVGVATMQVLPVPPSPNPPPPEEPAAPASPGPAPVTTAQSDPVVADGAWLSGDVRLRLHADPGESGAPVQEIRYTQSGAQQGGDTVTGDAAELTISAEGRTTVTFHARSEDGAAETPRTVTVAIDRAPPTVTWDGHATRYTVDQHVTLTPRAADALSGVRTTTGESVSGPAYAFGLGNHEYTATATDRAGNTSTGTARFTVTVTYDSLAALLRQMIPNAKTAASLSARLTAARNAAARRAPRTEARLVSEFTAAVKKQRGRTLSAAQVELLIRLAQACRGAAGQ